jgi:ornithine cyclodeaminase/alanine dehydrogenase-like protein (mu-crystallin family)
MSAPPSPSADTRWRCTRCGNLTRFDVTRRSWVRDFVHVDLAGNARVEEHEVLDEVIEQVRCRWCDGADSIELVARPGPDPST